MSRPSATTLLPHHASLIRASAVSDAVCAERGYWSATDKTDLLRLGFSAEQAIVPALVIPVHGVGGEVVSHQTRPDSPRLLGGKPVKYETPRGTRMHLDVPPRARVHLGDPAVPVVITEGLRKADSAVTCDLCCIGLLGVWNWRGTNERGGTLALGDWELIALNNRLAYLIFDSDVATKPEVRRALVRLAGFLRSRGAHVVALQLPAGENGAKIGMDDYLAAGNTAAELLRLPHLDLDLDEAAPRDRRNDSGLFEYTVTDAQKAGRGAGLQFLPFLGSDGLVVEGWSHLFASWWRLGKTELLARVIVPWLRLGIHVLWFTEEPESVWADRGDELDAVYGAGIPWDCLRIVYAVDADPRAMLERAVNGEEAVVIADTLRHACGIGDENSAGDVRRAVGPWIGAMARLGKTFIGLAHHRKAESQQPGERVAGSHALPALFDTALELRADKENQSRRLLSGRSRRFEIPPLVIERDDEGRMFIVGEAADLIARDLEQRCADALGEAADPLTTQQVRSGIGPDSPSVSTVLRALNRLATFGTITRDPAIGEEAAGRRVTWCLDLSDASAPTSASECPQ